jgi:hypothetical protein
MRVLPAAGAAFCNRQSPESDVVHDHIRFRQHQVVAVACIGIGTRHVQHMGTTETSETMGGSSCGVELSPGGGSSEVISDGSSDADR